MMLFRKTLSCRIIKLFVYGVENILLSHSNDLLIKIPRVQ